MPEIVEVTFRAQEWRGERAAPASREPNRATFEVPYEDALNEQGDLFEDFSYNSDALAEHDNAPDWVRDWVHSAEGPFCVQTEIIR